MTTLAKTDPRIDTFCGLVQEGIETWTRAGKLLCRMKDDDAMVFPKIIANHPYLTIETLENFERIGRRQIYPALVVDGSPGARRLATLPYAEQKRLYGARVAVVVCARGVTEQKFKRVFELTPREVSRVFNGRGLRSPKDQIALLARPKRNFAPTRHRSAESLLEESTSEPIAELDEKPIDTLTRQLTIANDAMLEARTALAMVKPGSRKDSHITAALIEIGSLRYAVSEGEL